MNAAFSLAPLFRHSVGFDQVNELMDAALRADQGSGFPPYDIIREADDQYRVVMAVAGFQQSDIEITVQENELKIIGRIEQDAATGTATSSSHAAPQPERIWLHRGIARRAFQRAFRLADHVEVTDARLENGLLEITLQRIIPEEKKLRTIKINTASTATAGAETETETSHSTAR